MSSDEMENGGPTRRAYVKRGGVVLGTSLLAGCSGRSSDETATGTSNASTGDSYSVTMSPVGSVEFESVPTSFLAYYPVSAGTAVALGHGESINALGYDKQLFGDTIDYYYDSLDSVDFDWEGLGRVTPSDDPGTLDKEAFYELDSDVHFLDPALLRSGSFGWSATDVREIRENVGPWFGNYYSRTNGQLPEAYRGNYDYYGLWEYIGRIAEVLQERERYRALRSVHDGLVSTIQSNLPPESERPTVAIVAYSGGTFWPYDFEQAGYLWAHVRPMGVTNAFDAVDGGPRADGSYDFEGLVETQPDVMLRYWGTALGQTFVDGRAEVYDHSLASEVPALRNERYYPSGHGMQGPVMNLFNLEMTAKQLYPERFGEWPGYGDGSAYPAIPEDERLFDRDKLASIITG